MKKTKSRIIKTRGNDVTVTRYVNGKPITNDTKALIGRLNKSLTNMLQLESFKEGIFLPDFDLDSGDFVYAHTLKENYVVSGTTNEPYKNDTIAIVASLLKCNHLLNIKSLRTVADLRGNKKTESVFTYSGIPCFLEQVTNELRQYDFGINPDTQYRVYTSAISVKETDQVSFVIGGAEKLFKVVATDYVTFPNMLVIEVNSDVREVV